jgi:type II secretory pathway pseudopilin PulG
MLMNKNMRLSNSGETIVEVLICVALIAITITATYVSGVDTMHKIQSAKEKQNAVSLARKQIELIASYTDTANTATANTATAKPPTSGTCLLLSSGAISEGTSGTNGTCNTTIESIKYNISDTKMSSPPAPANTYKIDISWNGSTGRNDVSMYYIRKN